MTKERKAVVTDEQIAEYVARPYARVLTPAEEGGYVVEVLEVPGAISQGETADEAVEMVNDALGLIIAVMLEDGEKIPEPVGFNEYSGRFNLRVSSAVHREAARRAQIEGVSLNQWVGQAVVARLAGKSLADEVVDKLRALIVTKETSRIVTKETSLETSLLIGGVQETDVAMQLPAPEPGSMVAPSQIHWGQSVQERSIIDA